MAAVAATRASRRWREASAPRGGGPCGDCSPNPSCHPAPVRPGTLPCSAFPRLLRPDTPTRSSRHGSAIAQGPDCCCAGYAVSSAPGRATTQRRTSTLRRAVRRRNWRFLFIFPDERLGQAPVKSGGSSQIGSSLLAVLLSPSWPSAVGRAPTLPGPSSSLECCKKQARSRRRSWSQASSGPRMGPRMSDEFGSCLELCGHLAQLFPAHPSVF